MQHSQLLMSGFLLILMSGGNILWVKVSSCMGQHRALSTGKVLSGCDDWLWSISTQPSPALARGQQGFTSPQLSRMPFCLHFIPVYSKMERVSDPNAAEARPRPRLSVGQLLEVFPWMHFSSRPPSQPISLHPRDKCRHHAVDCCRGERGGEGLIGARASALFRVLWCCAT